MTLTTRHSAACVYAVIVPGEGDEVSAFRRGESRLSLTELGKAILVRAEDFSRHNPVHRWWGGTELTNDRLWRWDPVLIAPGH